MYGSVTTHSSLRSYFTCRKFFESGQFITSPVKQSMDLCNASYVELTADGLEGITLSSGKSQPAIITSAVTSQKGKVILTLQHMAQKHSCYTKAHGDTVSVASFP